MKVWPESDLALCEAQDQELERLWPEYLRGVTRFFANDFLQKQ